FIVLLFSSDAMQSYFHVRSVMRRESRWAKLKLPHH
ncbi:hypothetical protein A2U01_0114151, partial [Trifolium medium]|nr:hypothetical protein [Trifolium medium]